MSRRAVDLLEVELPAFATAAEAWDHTGPSALPGWTVGDVVGHVAELVIEVAAGRVPTPGARPDPERRAGAVARLAGAADGALAAVADAQEPVAGDRLATFGHLGQHSRHLLADWLLCELIVHRHLDVATAGGDDDDGADRDDGASVRLAAEFALGVVPQQCGPALLGRLPGPTSVVVDGWSWSPVLWPVGEGVGLARGPAAAPGVGETGAVPNGAVPNGSSSTGSIPSESIPSGSVNEWALLAALTGRHAPPERSDVLDVAYRDGRW